MQGDKKISKIVEKRALFSVSFSVIKIGEYLTIFLKAFYDVISLTVFK